jgi:transcription antitermination protein NusB
MGARRKGRELAVQALYQIELRGEPAAGGLPAFFEQSEGSARAKEFAAVLVAAVREKQRRIDQLIADTSEHWRFERLSPVDLNVLRVAIAELLQSPRVPTSIVLDEAIEIARRFGSAESAVFVNGILDHIAGVLGVKETPARRGARGDG